MTSARAHLHPRRRRAGPWRARAAHGPRQARRLAAIVQSAEDAIVATDRRGIITDWNRGAERLYGYRATQAVGRSISILSPRERDDELPTVLRRLRRGERIDHYETVRVRQDGRRVDVSLRVSPVRDRCGRVVGTSTIARDLTPRRSLGRTQQDFIAMVSHELRTPLAAIKGYAQVMRRRRAYSAHSVDTVIQEASRLERLVDELLAVVRLESGRPTLERERTDVVGLARSVVERCRALRPGLTWRLEAPDGLLLGWWDADQLEQVLQHLLDNAAKHSPPGGDVLVRVEDRGAEARVIVQDRGAGIPRGTRSRLFERFYRADVDAPGLGVGLYIARRIVEAHGGRIGVESTPGHGATFYFTLPYREPTARRPPAALPGHSVRSRPSASGLQLRPLEPD